MGDLFYEGCRSNDDKYGDVFCLFTCSCPVNPSSCINSSEGILSGSLYTTRETNPRGEVRRLPALSFKLRMDAMFGVLAKETPYPALSRTPMKAGNWYDGKTIRLPPIAERFRFPNLCYDFDFDFVVEFPDRRMHHIQGRKDRITNAARNSLHPYVSTYI